MHVVVWDSGASSGHQVVNDPQRADAIGKALQRVMPTAQIRVMSADAYGAAAVVERQNREPMRRGHPNANTGN